MIRKLLVIAAAVAMPVSVVAVTSGVAGAKVKPTVDTTDGATATCTLSGGSIAFKTPIGIANPGGYVAPVKNKGQKITITGVAVSCTSSAVSGVFTGKASGKLTSTNPTETPAVFYSATSIEGNDPSAGGTLSGSLKIAWTAPVGQKFSDKKSTILIHSTIGGTVTISGDTYGSFTIPGSTPSSIVGAFGGPDGGATSTTFVATAPDEAALTPIALSAAGISSIALGSGTAALQ